MSEEWKMFAILIPEDMIKHSINKFYQIASKGYINGDISIIQILILKELIKKGERSFTVDKTKYTHELEKELRDI